MDKDELKNKIIDFTEGIIQKTGLSYRHKNLTWYFDRKDFLLILNLQRSMAGYDYFVNVMIALGSTKTFKYPKANQSDIRYRHSTQNGSEIIFDFQTDQNAFDKLRIAISEILEKTFSSLNEIEDLKKLYEKIKNLKSLDLTPEGRKTLDLL